MSIFKVSLHEQNILKLQCAHSDRIALWGKFKCRLISIETRSGAQPIRGTLSIDENVSKQ